MKKLFTLFLSASLLFVGGCKSKDQVSSDTPVNDLSLLETPDSRTDEEKELEMIQGCISDYNTGRISEVEEYLNTQLRPLPLEVDSLPEISSLSDLTEEVDDEEDANTAYVGSYMIDDKYKAVFTIYSPTGESFWLNGSILFQIDPESITLNDPQFTEYREAFETLLDKEFDVLNMLYGLDVSKSSEEGPEEGYYEVQEVMGSTVNSIQDLKDIAESVFTTDYLEDSFYYSAFYNESPIYKEIDGKLYVADSGMIHQGSSYTYEPSYIIAAEERDGTVYVDMLSSSLGELQSTIKRLTLTVTDNGYRLPSAF